MMSPAAEDMLVSFLEQLKIEKRASNHTVTNYQRDLRRLSAYGEEKLIDNWADLKQNDIRAHIAARHRKGICSKSLQRELSAIRSFYAFLLKNRLAESNPAQHVKAPKQARKLPKTLDVDQVRRWRCEIWPCSSCFIRQDLG
jgi:integrase/recombinase XerC